MLNDSAPLIMFGERCRIMREHRSLSQTDLCVRADLPNATLSIIENQRRVPTVPNLVKICQALEVSADYMLGLREEAIPNGPLTSHLLQTFSQLSSREQEIVVRLCDVLLAAKDAATAPEPHLNGLVAEPV